MSYEDFLGDRMRRIALNTCVDQRELLALEQVLDPQTGGLFVGGLAESHPMAEAECGLNAHGGPDAKVFAEVHGEGFSKPSLH